MRYQSVVVCVCVCVCARASTFIYVLNVLLSKGRKKEV